MPDDASIPALVAEHGKWLMAFLIGLTGNVADAEDAFQETWMRLIRSRAVARGAGFRSYLVKAARSVVIDRLRRSRPAESIDALDDEGEQVIGEIADSAPGPDERYESKATASDVRRAIAELPFNWRQVVLMRIEGEMEFKDIAAELGIPLGTALTWMHKATKELKRKLGGAG